MTDESVRIALGGRAEAPAVIELIHRVFDEYGFIWAPEEEFWDLLGAEFPYLEPRGALWVARDAAGRIVGSIAAERIDAATVEFHRLYLDAHLRGAGHGRRLMLEALAWARRAGCRDAVLWSDTRFDDAHRLYERLGFRRSGERALDDVNATVEFRYERRVDPDRAAGQEAAAGENEPAAD